MAWSGGSFTRANPTWVSDAGNGIGIEAGRHDAQDNDFTTGINQCLNKDGSNAATSNLNIGGFKVSNMATGTASGDATTLGQIQAGVNTQSTSLAITNTRFSADSSGAVFSLQKSRGASVGTNTIVQNGDTIGVFNFLGANGSSFTTGASITAIVDATPGATNDMPVRLSIATTPDGTGTPVERMSIGSAGQIIIKSDVSNTDGTGLDQGQLYIHDSDTSGSGLLLGYRYQSGVTEYARIQVRNGNNLVIQGGGGKVLINTTTIRNSAIQSLDFSASSGAAAYGTNDTSSTNAAVFHAFMTGGTYRGGITNSNNTAVAYNTTSDYRLKDDVSSMFGGLAKVKLLRPRTWKWKETGAPGQGFIAHELQEIIPDAVTGEKDAVYPDDSPKYQGVDLSFLVATLTNAIQELNAKVDALEARVAALEA